MRMNNLPEVKRVCLLLDTIDDLMSRFIKLIAI
jgi:hypothetical protein